MKEAKLIQTLQTLSAEEWNLLELKLLANDASRSVKVFSCLKPYFEESNKLVLPDKNTFFEVLYPKRAYNDQLLREEFSMLFFYVKDLLADIELKQDVTKRKVAALRQLRQRGLYKAYDAELKRAKKEMPNSFVGDETDHWNAMLLAEEGDQYFGMQQARRYDENLQIKVDELDRYYAIRKLKESCEMYNRKHIISSEYQVRLIEEVIQWVQRGEPQLQLPIVKVYYLILMTLRGENDEQYFEELIKALRDNWTSFPKAEARNMYRYAQNYCIRKINKGDRPYFGKLFHIYEELLITELILDEGQMDRTDYKNIATVAMRHGQQQWTASFLDRYKQMLPEKYRDMAYNMNMANYLYDISSYNAALDLLIHARFDDIFYDLSARHLLLKIYYDTNEFEAFTYQLESFRVFIKRTEKISTHNKNSNLNFLKVCRRLASLKQSAEYIQAKQFNDRMKKLRDVIDKYDPLANKPWLLQKAEQLAQQMA